MSNFSCIWAGGGLFSPQSALTWDPIMRQSHHHTIQRSVLSLALLVAMVLSVPFRLFACPGAGECPVAEFPVSGCCDPVDQTPVCPVHDDSNSSSCCFKDVGFAHEALVSGVRVNLASDHDGVQAEPHGEIQHPILSPSHFLILVRQGAPRPTSSPLPETSSRIHLHWCVLLR